MEEEQEQPKKTWSRKPKGPKISGDDAKVIVEALLKQIQQAPTKTLDVEAKVSIDRETKSQLEKLHAEPHYWFTWHKNGEDDNIDVEHVGVAGVPFYVRKEERVLVPHSFLQALKLAVVVGTDFLSPPVIINDRKYRKKKVERRFNYTVEPEVVSPEEAAAWRLRMERHSIETQDMIAVGEHANAMDDLVEVGR